jgi:opacity protein-like surface antigen
MKTKLTIFSLLFFLINPTQPLAALSGGDSSLAGASSKGFSENPLGLGLSAGLRFNLVEDIFSDSEEPQYKSKHAPKTSTAQNKDHIFAEIEAFANQFISGDLNQNFGARANLGYEIAGFRLYASGGYTASTTDYKEEDKSSQSVTASAPFFGLGLGYDITKNFSVRLNSMFYNFDFTPKNSDFNKINVDVAAVTLGLGVYF